jgi:hypothetical protein
MEMQITKNNIEILRESLYGFRPIEESTGTGSEKRRSGSNRGGVERDSSYGNRLALPPKGKVKPDEQKAIAPLKSFLAKKEYDVILLDKEADPGNVFNIDKTFFSISFYTEFVKDQYTIGRVVFDAANSAIGKYRETQAYPRLLPESILEVYA